VSSVVESSFLDALQRVSQRLQRVAELLHGAKHAVLGGTRPEAERPADFVDRSPLVMPKRERGALERAECAERMLDTTADFGALREPLRVRCIRRWHIGRRFQRFASRLIVACLFRAHQIHRAVRDNPLQPGAEVRARLEAAELSIRAKKTLLNHVFGILFISRHPEGQPEHSPAVPLYERAKRVAVTLAGTGQDSCSFGRVHHSPD